MDYTDKFRHAIPNTMEFEGHFTDDPDDIGGATNYGISLRFLLSTGDLKLGDIDHDGDIDYNDIRKITPEAAVEIYYTYFWLPGGYEKINDFDLAAKAFDVSVNMGMRQAAKLLQLAVKTLGGVITIDGCLGPKSFFVINSFKPVDLLNAYRQELVDFYLALMAKKPQLKKYRRGWLLRARS
jgi:lysozyme family protein